MNNEVKMVLKVTEERKRFFQYHNKKCDVISTFTWVRERSTLV